MGGVDVGRGVSVAEVPLHAGDDPFGIGGPGGEVHLERGGAVGDVCGDLGRRREVGVSDDDVLGGGVGCTLVVGDREGHGVVALRHVDVAGLGIRGGVSVAEVPGVARDQTAHVGAEQAREEDLDSRVARQG